MLNSMGIIIGEVVNESFKSQFSSLDPHPSTTTTTTSPLTTTSLATGNIHNKFSMMNSY